MDRDSIMRKIILPELVTETGNYAQYPEGVLPEEIANTFIDTEGNLVGEYSGSLDEDAISTWVGTRPSVYKEYFSATELLESFTSEESFAALTSSNPAVVGQAQLLGMKRDKMISKDAAGYITAIEDLRTEGIFDNDMADAYLMGLPEGRFS